MLGPYEAKKDGTAIYKGNKIFPSLENVLKIPVDKAEIEKRVISIHSNQMWPHITRINSQINRSVNNFFYYSIDALFIPLNLTTRMISSPGAVYGKNAINYTTDTMPITLKWFDLPRQAFLSESSQIYLELALLQNQTNHVFSNYNSFRKERADSTHLSEFHHVEYEGKISQVQNEAVMAGLIKTIIEDLLSHNEEDLSFFLANTKLDELSNLSSRISNHIFSQKQSPHHVYDPKMSVLNTESKIKKLTFLEAMELLYKDTKNEKYKSGSLQDFGSWEEIRLTQIVGDMVFVTEMPLLEVPFYHAMKDGKEPRVADNADLIWPGYRETIGSGHRVRSIKELEEKAKIFHLPLEDYEPYIQSRKFADYHETSGFGLGWERLIHGLLEMPFIYTASMFPRIDSTLLP